MSIANQRLSVQAIVVKYLSATNTKGSRYKAFCQAGHLTRDFNSLDGNMNNKAAQVACQLIDKLGWNEGCVWYQGTMLNGDYVFVRHFDDDKPRG